MTKDTNYVGKIGSTNYMDILAVSQWLSTLTLNLHLQASYLVKLCLGFLICEMNTRGQFLLGQNQLTLEHTLTLSVTLLPSY